MKQTPAIYTLLFATILISQSVLAAMPIGDQAQGTDFVPGQLPTVRGSVQVTGGEPLGRINPNRPSRTLGYRYPPRQSYRQGRTDYYTLTKEARYEMRPQMEVGIRDVQMKKIGSFIKTAPALHPYATSTGLRQSISSTKGTNTVSSRTRRSVFND